MTTDLLITKALDVTSENEVINFYESSILEGRELAGVGWSFRGGPALDGLLVGLRLFLNEFWRDFDDYLVWLLAGTSAWQPGTRIVRHRKLWGALEVRGIKITHASNAQEKVLSDGDRLKFFGALQISELSLQSVAEALLKERCTCLALLPRASELDEILNIEWSGDLSFDAELVAALADREGVLIKQFGEFDDRERGLILVGKRKVIESRFDRIF